MSHFSNKSRLRLQQALNQANKVPIGKLSNYPSPIELFKQRIEAIDRATIKTQSINANQSATQHPNIWANFANQSLRNSQTNNYLQQKYKRIYQDYRSSIRAEIQSQFKNPILRNQAILQQKSQQSPKINEKIDEPLTFGKGKKSQNIVQNPAQPIIQQQKPKFNIFGDNCSFGSMAAPPRQPPSEFKPNEKLFSEYNPIANLQTNNQAINLFNNQQSKTSKTVQSQQKARIAPKNIFSSNNNSNIFQKPQNNEASELQKSMFSNNIQNLQPKKNFFNLNNQPLQKNIGTSEFNQTSNIFGTQGLQKKQQKIIVSQQDDQNKQLQKSIQKQQKQPTKNAVFNFPQKKVSELNFANKQKQSQQPFANTIKPFMKEKQKVQDNGNNENNFMKQTSSFQGFGTANNQSILFQNQPKSLFSNQTLKSNFNPFQPEKHIQQKQSKTQVQKQQKPLFNLTPVPIQEKSKPNNEYRIQQAPQKQKQKQKNIFEMKSSESLFGGDNFKKTETKNQNKKASDILGSFGKQNQGAPSLFTNKNITADQKVSSTNPFNNSNLFAQNIFGKSSGQLFGNSDSLFSKPAGQNVKNELKEQMGENKQDEGEDQEQEKLKQQQQLEHDPSKSSGNYKYDKSDILFKETALKFKKGTGQAMENMTISVQKTGDNPHKIIYARMPNKIVNFYGTFMKGITEVSQMNNNAENIAIKKILYTDGKQKPVPIALKFKFKDKKIGEKFKDILKKDQ